MPMLDILNSDAFSLIPLTQVIIDIPVIPTKIGDRKLFSEDSLTGLAMMIERQGDQLSLVPSAPRGGIRATLREGKRKLIPIASTHLPQQASVMADEIMGVRVFGTESQEESVMKLLQRRLTHMKRNIDLTLEWHRVGAIKGQVLDANGTDVLWDMYDIMGMVQATIYYNISAGNESIDPVAKNTELKRAMEDILGGRSFTGIRVLCSRSFFDKWTRHDKMKAAWDTWNANAYLRQAANEQGFPFDGVTYEVYNGAIGGTKMIPDGLAYAYPEGVPGMFQTWYSPADYMETAGTSGLPYYAKQERMEYDKGAKMESQSNPLHFNSLPEAVFKLSIAAS